MSTTQTDPYTVLQLKKGVSEEEIKQAYYESVKKWDPENHPDRFMVIQQAYDRLRDPVKRAKADLFSYNWVKGEFNYTAEEREGPAIPELQRRIQALLETFKGGDKSVAGQLVNSLFALSYQNFRSKKWSEAIENLNLALTVDPTNQRAKSNLNLALMRMGWSFATNNLIEEAIAEWEKSLTMNPDNLPVIHNLAIASESHGDSARADRYWAETQRRWKALHEKDQENEYYKCLLVEMHKHFGGRGLQKSEEKGEEPTQSAKELSIDEYREVLKINPDDFEAQLKIAEAMMEKKRWAEAVAELRRLAQKHQDNIQVLDMYSWALLNSGAIDQAFINWKRGMKLHRENQTLKASQIKARMELGKKSRASGQFTMALVHFKELAKLVGMKSPEIHKELGETFLQQGDKGSAYKHFMIAAKLDPKDKDVKRAISDLKMRGG